LIYNFIVQEVEGFNKIRKMTDFLNWPFSYLNTLPLGVLLYFTSGKAKGSHELEVEQVDMAV